MWKLQQSSSTKYWARWTGLPSQWMWHLFHPFVSSRFHIQILILMEEMYPIVMYNRHLWPFCILTRTWNQRIKQKGTSRYHTSRSWYRIKFGRWKQNGILSNFMACHVVPLENGEFLYLGLENYDFAVYSNICFINNFFFF